MQKIAIARANYKNAAIIFLEEPTSALDLVTEYEIMNSFNNIILNKTVYIASIIKLPFYKQYISKDEGKIVEDGTHTELCRIKKNDIIRCLIVRRNIMYNFRIGDF